MTDQDTNLILADIARVDGEAIHNEKLLRDAQTDLRVARSYAVLDVRSVGAMPIPLLETRVHNLTKIVATQRKVVRRLWAQYDATR